MPMLIAQFLYMCNMKLSMMTAITAPIRSAIHRRGLAEIDVIPCVSVKVHKSVHHRCRRKDHPTEAEVGDHGLAGRVWGPVWPTVSVFHGKVSLHYEVAGVTAYAQASFRTSDICPADRIRPPGASGTCMPSSALSPERWWQLRLAAPSLSRPCAPEVPAPAWAWRHCKDSSVGTGALACTSVRSNPIATGALRHGNARKFSWRVLIPSRILIVALRQGLADLQDREHSTHRDVVMRTFTADHRNAVWWHLHSHVAHVSHPFLAHGHIVGRSGRTF